jgi:hypothetical protein
MELNGKVVVVLPSTSGQSAAGKNWKKQEVVVETLDQFPKKVAFELWNDDCRQLESLKTGNHVKVLFNVESREFDGRWFTQLKCWKLTVTGV